MARLDPEFVKYGVQVYRIVYRSILAVLHAVLFIVIFLCHHKVWGGLFLPFTLFHAWWTLKAIRTTIELRASRVRNDC